MSARLFVLGVLNERDSHGYDIKEIARTWNLDKWSDIGYGSIYHALGALAAEGSVEEVGVEQEGGRPLRSIYRITDRGRAQFLQLVREACTSGYPERHPVNLGLSFITRLPPEERVALLEGRLDALETAQRQVTERLAQLRPLMTEAPWVIATLEHDLSHREVEIDWTRRLIPEVARWVPRAG